MNDLKIKKDGKTIFDSHGATLEHTDSLEILGDIAGSVTSPKFSYEVVVTIKCTSPSSPSLVDTELNNNVTKL
jgi:hypothetical protein